MVQSKDVQETIDQVESLINQLSLQYKQLIEKSQDKDELTKIQQQIKALEFNLSKILPNQKCSISTSQNGSISKIDKLKKRAERFGCISSSEIKNVINNEILLKRKQKFNEVELSKDNGRKISLNKLDPNEAKKKRLERFAAHM